MLRNWGTGYIIVQAETVSDARQVAREHFNKWLSEERGWIADDPEEVAEYRKKLEADLAIEPEVHTVLFIPGSD